MTSQLPDQLATESGTYMGQSDWLDLHFQAHRPEYEQAFHMVGFQPGWHVLDAGCGGGSFLPLLTESVGPGGRVTASDLDPDNVAKVQRRVVESPLACSVDATTADLRDLPFPDDTFDAVWLANVLMYVTDEDFPRVLSELMRVVRPGGLVASKEGDGELFRYLPVPFEHRAPFYHANLVIPSFFRARQNLHWYRRAGLQDAWAKSVLVERWAPLDEINRQHIIGLSRGGLFTLNKLDPATVSAETWAFWEQQVDPDSPDCIANHPDFAFAIAQVVTVGRVPDVSG